MRRTKSDWQKSSAFISPVFEAPLVRNPRVDLLGESPDRKLFQIEFQSRNERHFPLRMAEYLFSIGVCHGRLHRQIVLYVGEKPMRMKDRVEGPDYSVRFHLESPNLGDSIIAILYSDSV